MLDSDRLHSAISALRSKQLFFVGGVVKSGTTWLELLLNLHPGVSCHGEGHFLDVLVPELKLAFANHRRLVVQKNETVFSELEGYRCLSEDELNYVLRSCIAIFLIKQSQHKSAYAIGERTPDNVRSFPGFHLLFPAAKFIQIIRDGRDCAVSAWFHNLRTTPRWAAKEFGSLEAYADKFAPVWAGELAAAQAFANQYPNQCHYIRYEDLTANTEGVLAAIFEFLGVDASPQVLAHCRAEADFAKLSGGRRPGNEDRGSFFRKGIVGDWRNHLGDEANARFREQAGTWLDTFGYP